MRSRDNIVQRNNSFRSSNSRNTQDKSRSGSVYSNVSNITVDLDVDYHSHIAEIAIGIFDEYLRKDSPNKIEVDDEILL